MVSSMTQSGIDRVHRLTIDSTNPIVKTSQDKITLVVLSIGVFNFIFKI